MAIKIIKVLHGAIKALILIKKIADAIKMPKTEDYLGNKNK